ncbi:MAG: hypothetical protein ACRDS9_16420 [Pseudonocardiaceae bacterium]
MGSGQVDEDGVAFVSAGGPGGRRSGFLSEPDVAGNESADTLAFIEVDVPDFVELGPDPAPAVVVEEQVVAFGARCRNLAIPGPAGNAERRR